MLSLMGKYDKIFRYGYLEAKESMEVALMKIRNEGASMCDSVKVLKNVLQISLSEADDLVVNSLTWKDWKKSVEELRQALETALGEEPDGEICDR